MACSLIFLGTGCHDEPVGDSFYEDNYSEVKGSIVAPQDVQVGFFDLGDLEGSEIAFDLVYLSGETPTNVDVKVMYGTAGDLSQPVSLTSVSSLPATISVTANEVLNALSLTADDIEIGDIVIFVFDATTASGTFRSNRFQEIPFSCSSDLAGTYDYVSTTYFCSGPDLTGEVTITQVSSGKYTISDWSFGTYPECYGGPAANWGSLQLSDVCNVISVLGVDNYGDSWDILIQDVSGQDFTFTWSNTYGETGTVTLTTQDGSEWPPLSN